MIVFAGDSITDADKNTTMDRIGNGYVRLMREALAAFSADWLSHVQCDRERRQFTLLLQESFSTARKKSAYRTFVLWKPGRSSYSCEASKSASAEIAGEIDWVIAHKDLCGRIVDKLDSGEIPFRVTHNDTKLNNVMLDDATGKGIAVIDLDTVMPGSLCYDFGDSIRFGCSSAAEDEPDLSKVFFRYELYETYLRGYLHAVGDCITKEELENLPIGAIVITYECGMRFLTDYLEGDIYFRTTRPKQNLDRARTQFKLVEDMLLVFDKMCKTVEEVCHVTGAREQSILSA